MIYHLPKHISRIPRFYSLPISLRNSFHQPRNIFRCHVSYLHYTHPHSYCHHSNFQHPFHVTNHPSNYLRNENHLHVYIHHIRLPYHFPIVLRKCPHLYDRTCHIHTPYYLSIHPHISHHQATPKCHTHLLLNFSILRHIKLRSWINKHNVFISFKQL